jgi:hypothetical protein
MSCFDEMDDELIDSPQDSFAAMCYQSAVTRRTADDPDWCVFIRTPNRCNWQGDEDTLESPVDSSLGSLVGRFIPSLFMKTDKVCRYLPA